MYRQINIRPTCHINIGRRDLIDRKSGRIGVDRIITGYLGNRGIEREVRIIPRDDSSGRVPDEPVSRDIGSLNKDISCSLGVSTESRIDCLSRSVSGVTSDFGDIGKGGEEVGDICLCTAIYTSPAITHNHYC